jgi:peptide/nickel transport system permease protein
MSQRLSGAAYYLKKLLAFFLSVFALSLAVFAISRLAPGDPLVSYYGERAEKMSPQERERTMDRLGLNAPLHVQYLKWLQNALHGEMGVSFKYKQDVLAVIASRLPNTLLLGGIGFLLLFVLSLLLGVLCAWREDGLVDRVVCRVGTALSCVPEFWLSLMLILVFCVTLKWLPSSGAYSTGRAGDILDRARHLVLPLTVVVSSHLWYYAYMVRNKLLDEVRADYVLLLRAKGLRRRAIVFGHCLRGILPAYLSLMAISVPHVLGGTYIVETVFSYPGLGTLSYESARFHDYNMLMVLCLLTGATVIFCNMLGQVLSERIDPRIRLEDAPQPRKEAGAP